MERFALTLFRLKGSLGISLINTRLQLFRAVIKSRGRGIPLATINMVPGYFHWRIEEK